MDESFTVTRRGFLEATGVALAAGTFVHPAIGRAHGANDRLNFAILGAGGRAQAHISHLLDLKREGSGVDIVGVCDVWDGYDGKVTNWDGSETTPFARGLGPSAKRCGLDPDDKAGVTKDYRRLLDRKDVDAVVIATPDHWHARMALDAMAAGKDVFCEKPMCHTLDEARLITEARARTGRIFVVGVQSMANPVWRKAHELIAAGKIGHVLQGQTSYSRNSAMGQWRYYPLVEEMNPRTVDWPMFLGTAFGLAPDQPFDRARYAQWRCYWDFGGGMYTDLFVHQLTHLIRAMGVRFPRRVVGAGGLYLEYDGREVPDVATVVADYDEGCQVIISATMGNDVQLGEVIRGHTGTIRFDAGVPRGFRVAAQKLEGRPAPPGANKGEEGEYVDAGFDSEKDRDTRALWEHFLGCIRSRDPETLCPAELGYAAIATVNLGVESYRAGKAYFFDRGTGVVTEADRSWAKRWEERSARRGRPNQVLGWKADLLEGSTIRSPAYNRRLEGPWIEGKDPAEA